MANTVSYAYLPNDEVGRADWLNNFALVFPNYATGLGNTQPQVDYVAVAATSYNYAVNTLSGVLRDLSKTVTTYKDLLEADRTPDPVEFPTLTLPQPPAIPAGVALKTGIFVWMNDLVVEIRKSPGYNEAIGQALRIIAITPPAKIDGRISKIEAISGSVVHLTLVRHGRMAILEGTRNNGPWEVVATIAVSDFEDKRPPLLAGKSEVRSYRLRLTDGANPIGDYSDPVSIATRP